MVPTCAVCGKFGSFPSRFVDHPFLVEKLMAPYDVAEKDLRAVVSSIFDAGLSDGVGEGA